MSQYLVYYLACVIIFFPVDFVWLSVMGGRFYRPELGSLLRDKPNLAVAGLFYAAYVAGIVLFAVAPAGSAVEAGLLGAALGFIAYGTYDLTNLSTMRGFTTRAALVDMAWGTALSAVTAGGGFALAQLFL